MWNIDVMKMTTELSMDLRFVASKVNTCEDLLTNFRSGTLTKYP